MAEQGCVKFIGFGEARTMESEMVDNDQVLAKLKEAGVETKGKIGEDVEKLVGIKKRWHSYQTSFDLAHFASLAACQNAREKTHSAFKNERLQLIHSGGASPDDVFPACACRLQYELGAVNCEARDISLACTSWLDGVLLAASRMRDKGLHYGLVAVGETIGSKMNPPTSFDYSLWADGGGAVVLEFDRDGDSHYGIVADKGISDGRYANWTRSIGVGVRRYHRDQTLNSSMEGHGKDIHRYVIEDVSRYLVEFLDEEGIEGEYPYLLPHNANLSMVRKVGKKIGLPPERVLTTIEDRGNTSSASIPITLAHYEKQNKFKKDDLLIFAAFGGGMSIDFMLYRWP